MNPTNLVLRVRDFVKKHLQIFLWVGGSIIVVVGLAVSLFYFAGFVVTPTTERSDHVVEFMHDFGDAIVTVGTASTSEERVISMGQVYSPYLDSRILDEWKADPAKAFESLPPGAQPTALRVKSVQNVGILTYLVKVYVATDERVTIPGLGTGVAKTEYPFTFGVSWRGGGWKITEIVSGHPGSE